MKNNINQIIQVLIPGIFFSITFFNFFSGNHLEAIFWLILTIHISNQL